MSAPGLSLVPQTERGFAVRRILLFLAFASGLMLLLIVVHIAVGTLDFSPRQNLLALMNRAEDPVQRQVV